MLCNIEYFFRKYQLHKFQLGVARMESGAALSSWLLFLLIDLHIVNWNLSVPTKWQYFFLQASEWAKEKIGGPTSRH